VPSGQIANGDCLRALTGEYNKVMVSKSAIRRPQLECAVERSGGYILRIGRDVHRNDLVVVALQRLQRLPRLVGPDLGGRVVGTGDQKAAALLLVLHVRNQVGVGGNGQSL